MRRRLNLEDFFQSLLMMKYETCSRTGIQSYIVSDYYPDFSVPASEREKNEWVFSPSFKEREREKMSENEKLCKDIEILEGDPRGEELFFDLSLLSFFISIPLFLITIMHDDDDLIYLTTKGGPWSPFVKIIQWCQSVTRHWEDQSINSRGQIQTRDLLMIGAINKYSGIECQVLNVKEYWRNHRLIFWYLCGGDRNPVDQSTHQKSNLLISVSLISWFFLSFSFSN